MAEKILLVDDDRHSLDAIAVALRRRFAVSVAAGAKEGLERVCADGPYAVVVSDYKMPGMDGVEFLARVRELAPGSVRVMLTGHGDLEAAVAAVNKGEVFRFLTKPCPTAVLGAALDAGVEKYRREGSLAETAAEAPAKVETGPDAARLTRRERQVAAMIRRGDATKQIAAALHLSSRTVETYRDNIRKKLGLSGNKVSLQTYLAKNAL